MYILSTMFTILFPLDSTEIFSSPVNLSQWKQKQILNLDWDIKIKIHTYQGEREKKRNILWGEIQELWVEKPIQHRGLGPVIHREKHWPTEISLLIFWPSGYEQYIIASEILSSSPLMTKQPICTVLLYWKRPQQSWALRIEDKRIGSLGVLLRKNR